MLISQLLQQPVRSDFHAIAEQCTEFVSESQGRPLFKFLPEEYADVHKVKARKRNIRNQFADTFNEAFSSHVNGLCQRAIYAYGATSVERVCEGDDPFYVFPIDGYRYLYSTEVQSSNEDYKQVFEMMFEQFGPDKGREMIADLVKFSYTSSNLVEGIERGSEIIFYNIPYYYAVRVEAAPDYDELLSLIDKSK
jgi:hypothetical protein